MVLLFYHVVPCLKIYNDYKPVYIDYPILYDSTNNSNINPIKFIDQQKELTKKSLPKENRFVYNKILHLNIDSRSRITSMNEIEPYGYNSTGRNYNKEFKFKPFSTNIDISSYNCYIVLEI